MTGQDWVIIGAGWLALAIVLAGTMLDRRNDSRRLDRHRDDLNNHGRRMVLIEGAVDGLPTTTHAPMPTVRRSTLARASIGSSAAVVTVGQQPSIDRTLRLSRPPSILPPPEPTTDIERVLTTATRPLTRNEIASHLNRPGWELIPELAALIKANKIAPTAGHSPNLAYRLVPTTSDTQRMGRMSVLPGVVR